MTKNPKLTLQKFFAILISANIACPPALATTYLYKQAIQEVRPTDSVDYTANSAVFTTVETAVNFGNIPVGSEQVRTVTVTNIGSKAETPAVLLNSPDFELVTNNCTNSIAPGQSCTVVIKAVASSAGAKNATLSINGEKSARSVFLSSTGIVDSLTASSYTYSFGALSLSDTNQTVSTATFQIKNTGSATAVNVSGASLSAYKVTTNCQSLATNATCVVNVDIPDTTLLAKGYNPASIVVSGANSSITLNVNTYKPTEDPMGALTVEGDGTFGTVIQTGTSTVKTLTFKNSGTAKLSTYQAQVYDSTAYSIVTDNCSNKDLSAGSTCDIAVKFAPTTAGQEIGRIILDSSVGAKSVNLTANSVAASYSLSRNNINFGIVPAGQQAEESVTITNDGTLGSVKIDSVVSASGTPLQVGLSQDNCTGTTLAPAQTCTFAVRYSPIDVQTLGGGVTVSATAVGVGAMSNKVVSFSGTGQKAKFTLTQLDSFTTIQTGQVVIKRVRVTNTGNVVLDGFTNKLTGDASITVYDAGTCSSILAGDFCDISIRYAPTVAGTASTQLDVGYSQVPSQSLQLSATAADAVLEYSTSNGLDFGAALVGSVASSKSIQYINRGIGPIDITNTEVSNSAFAASYNCNGTTSGSTITLAPGQSCVASFTATPAIAGANEGTFVVTTSAGASSFSLTTTGLVKNVLAENLSFGTVLVGQSKDVSVKVSNVGTATLDGFQTVINDTNNIFAIQSSTCTDTLSTGSGGVCNVVVRFTPTSQSNFSAPLIIGSGSYSKNYTLSGSGLTPTATFSYINPSIEFGSVTLNQYNSKVISLTNSGTGSGTLTPSLFNTSNGFVIQSNSCTNIAVGGTCSLTIGTTPVVRGPIANKLILQSSGGSSTLDINASVVGDSLSATPNPLTGTVDYAANGTQSFDVTVSNSGTASTAISTSVQNDTNSIITDVSKESACASIGPNSSCKVTVTVKKDPAVTSLNATLNIVGTSTSTSVPVQMSFTKGAITAGNVSVGLVQVGQSGTASSTLSNSGTGLVSGLSVALDQSALASKLSVALVNADNSACTSLTAGSSCQVKVVYTPTANEAINTTATISSNVGSKQITITGTAGSPEASLSTTNLNFSVVRVGKSSTLPVTVTNVGSIGNLAVSSTNNVSNVSVNTSSCSAVAPAATCTVNVTYSPTASSSSELSNKTITINGQTVTLDGHGYAPALTTASNTSYGFGYVQLGQQATTNVVVTNSGNIDLTGFAVTNSDASGKFTVLNNTCATTLGAGANCSFDVKYTPATTNAESATITVSNSSGNTDNNAAPLSFTYSGTGSNASTTFSSNSLTFSGTQLNKTSESMNVLMTNAGYGPVTVNSISNTGPYTVTQSCGTPPFVMAAHAVCTVSVTSTPTVQGANPGVLTVNTTGGNASITLANTGLNSDVSATGLSFGTVQYAGTAKTQDITITNSGNQDLTGLAFASQSAEFVINSSTCSSSLAVGSTCKLNVTFTPASNTSSRSAVIRATATGPVSFTKDLSMTATVTTPSVSFSPSAATQTSSVYLGSIYSYTYTITNNGADTVTIGTQTIANDVSSPANKWVAGTGTCTSGTVLAPTASCTYITKLDLTGTATAGAYKSVTTLKVNGVTDYTNTNMVTAYATSVTASPSPLTFSDTNVNSYSTATLIVTNNGSLPVYNLAASFSDSQFTWTTGGTCVANQTLAVGGNCTIVVKFAPTAMATLTGTTITVKTDNMASGGLTTSTVVSINSVKGLQTQFDEVDLNSISLGTIPDGTTAYRLVNFKNNGNTPVTINGVVAYDYSSGTAVSSGLVTADSGPANNASWCWINRVVQPGESCFVTGGFSSAVTGAGIGAKTAQIALSTSAGTKLAYATIIDKVALSVSVSSGTSIPTIGQTSVAYWTITNNTGNTLTNATWTPSPSGIVSLDTTNTCGTTLVPGGTCKLALLFNPTSTTSQPYSVQLKGMFYQVTNNGFNTTINQDSNTPTSTVQVLNSAIVAGPVYGTAVDYRSQLSSFVYNTYLIPNTQSYTVYQPNSNASSYVWSNGKSYTFGKVYNNTGSTAANYVFYYNVDDYATNLYVNGNLINSNSLSNTGNQPITLQPGYNSIIVTVTNATLGGTNGSWTSGNWASYQMLVKTSAGGTVVADVNGNTDSSGWKINSAPETLPMVGDGSSGNPWYYVDGSKPASCKGYKNPSTSYATGSTSGYYSISGTGTVYCDMTTDGGGWTLVGRSKPGNSRYWTCEGLPTTSGANRPFGWRTNTGSVSNDSSEYSINSTGIPLSQVLAGYYSSGKSWGSWYYRINVPTDYLTNSAYFNATASIGVYPAVPSGSSGSSTAHMLAFYGYTNHSYAFQFRDNSAPDYGLVADGWATCYDDAFTNNGIEPGFNGYLNAKQGMIMTR